ncbi:MFS transporter [Nocardiopsis sp. NPDC006938]|uniref:MFS transporter n=1 Tax=Nocardiopsis sp. NPDC006938 TaxID=3364337 RepID=UPI00367E0245
MTQNVNAPPRAGRREWAGLALLLVPAMLVMMDLTLLHLAVPQLSADLDPSGTQLLWITDVYGFFVAGLLLTMGTIGDRLGRRRMVMIGAAAFTSVSVLAAFSSSPEMLILARALLGVAGATLAPSTLSLITTLFRDPAQRSVAISLWMTSFMAGGALGPVVGGVLLEFFWWGSVFLLAVPVMLPLLLFGGRLLPEHRNPEPGPLDLVSVFLSLTGVLTLVYGIKETVRDGLALTPLLALAVGAVLLTSFVRRQLRASAPFFDVTLFRNRAFGTALVTLSTTALLIAGVQFLVAQYLQMVQGLSPMVAGLWMLPMVAGGVASVLAASTVVRRVRPAVVFATGLLVAALGFGLLTQAGADAALAVVVVGSTLMFAGLMPVSALGTDVVMSTAPQESAGTVAGMAETTQELGAALGIAVIGVVSAGLYAARTSLSLPAELSEAQARSAGSTIGAAHQVAESLPEAVGAEVLDAARAAFAHGLQVNAAVAALILVVLAAVVSLVLRRVPAAGGAEPVTGGEDGGT